MTRLTLIPLDDRPVSVGIPVEIAAVAGVEVETPPAELRPHKRISAPVDDLAAWAGQSRGRTDATVASLDAAGFGSLIASRTSHAGVAETLAAWTSLTTPGNPVYAALVVPRTPNSTDIQEEPAYWDPHGPALHRLSARLGTTDEDLDTALAAVAPQVPRPIADEWIGRRLRQQTLALSALHLAHEGRFASLVIGIDDATTTSLSSAAQRDLDTWVRRLGMADRVLVHPGADETGAVLVARALLRLTGVDTPIVGIACADPEGMERVAPYETGPVRLTVRRQLLAAGALLAGPGGLDDVDADVVLVVHPPTGKSGDWAGETVSADIEAARATAALAAELVAAGTPVAVADVGQPNGADPALVAALSERGLWDSLVGYAAWNTAGNTLGTVAAQVVATWVGRQAGTFDAEAHRRMIGRRVAEDYGWMSVVRAQARAEIGSRPGFHDEVDVPEATVHRWETAVADALAGVEGLDDVRVVPGSLTFPWERTFEVDFAVETGTQVAR